jgi:peptide/nickel transport system ATP-binding protein
MITMYAGEVVEDAPVDDVLMRPLHPYTSGLLRSLPRFSERRGALGSIPGRVPSPGAMPAGCRFRSRCKYAVAGCEREQAMVGAADYRRARCWRSNDLDLPGAVN